MTCLAYAMINTFWNVSRYIMLCLKKKYFIRSFRYYLLLFRHRHISSNCYYFVNLLCRFGSFFFLYAVEYKICSRNRNIIQQAVSHNTRKKQNKYMSRWRSRRACTIQIYICIETTVVVEKEFRFNTPNVRIFRKKIVPISNALPNWRIRSFWARKKCKRKIFSIQ